ncbi:MAG: BBP7 family outer membrane beta-barrel protein [Planctomycetota bacterium]
MTGRTVCLIAVILLSIGVSQSEAQTYGPPMGSSNPIPLLGTGHPLTPHYTPGPANWAHDNITADRGGLYEESPLDEFVRDMARDSFVRIEWLQWHFKKPGDDPLGANITSVVDVREPFTAVVSGNPVGEARVESLAGVKLGDVNGIRGTLGVPLGKATVEANIFSFSDVEERTFVDDLGLPTGNNPLEPPRFVATTTLTNGVPGTNTLLYDNSYSTRFTSNLWGTGINYVFEAPLAPPFIQIRPMFGFRFISLDEQLVQNGVFDGFGQLTPAQTVNTVISSDTANNVYVPQLGARVEYESRWVSIGVEGKFGLGVNQYRGAVFTDALRAAEDPRVDSSESGEKLSATGEFAVYGKVHINKNFSLNVGYTIMFVDNITRPHNSILYNDNGPFPAPAAVVADPSFELMYFQGLNVGGELRF